MGRKYRLKGEFVKDGGKLCRLRMRAFLILGAKAGDTAVIRFTKMQGLGNDYIYINAFEERVDDPAALARKISDRHFGVGSDGLVLIAPSETADFRMVMYNADGSRGAMCGNAARCVAKYVYDRGMTQKTVIELQTDSGIKTLHLTVRDGVTQSVCVDMGAPILACEDVPCTLGRGVVKRAAVAALGRTFEVTPVSMGNPHCVIFVRDPDYVDLEQIGPLLENNAIFPQRANVEFVQVVSRDHLRMRVWERGSGETLACGTGACASVVAAREREMVDNEVVVHLRGGDLHIIICPNGHIEMTGKAEFVFSGTIEI